LNENGQYIEGDASSLSINLQKRIVEEEMDCANIYHYNVRLSLEKIIKILEQSNGSVFTIGLKSKSPGKKSQLGSDKTIVGYLS
jgi:hypothetical protein